MKKTPETKLEELKSLLNATVHEWSALAGGLFWLNDRKECDASKVLRRCAEELDSILSRLDR